MSVTVDRAATILARFNAAQNTLAARLRDLSPAAAEQRPDPNAWSAAQVGWHVAQTNDLFAAMLTGETPMAKPVDAAFTERFDPSVLPERIETSPQLEPPAHVGRDLALERLRASGQHMSKAIASLTPDRGAGYCVTFKFGTLSLFEVAGFAAAHVMRHVAQVDRAASRAAVRT